ncbi:uncharacterized protein BXZ73DRAFT_80305 [Epithele typhae]|uniref:uncharacterized protein n=1 Tax=Epithele typhae TaxID=378194 RepID=UPI0020078605|nr:uncharacterized protein BXZ73DRAFT_80305 [Epithele typhae]KAH9919791.1 hypothetical protein BXZ73DRAFT_80305 [Epithele typhae]
MAILDEFERCVHVALRGSLTFRHEALRNTLAGPHHPVISSPTTSAVGTSDSSSQPTCVEAGGPQPARPPRRDSHRLSDVRWAHIRGRGRAKISARKVERGGESEREHPMHSLSSQDKAAPENSPMNVRSECREEAQRATRVHSPFRAIVKSNSLCFLYAFRPQQCPSSAANPPPSPIPKNAVQSHLCSGGVDRVTGSFFE